MNMMNKIRPVIKCSCRWLRRLWVAPALAVSLAAVTSGDEPAAEPLRQRVERLVEQLDAPQAGRRAAAEQQLIELGEPIRGLLPADSDDLPPEIRQRLKRVRQRLVAGPPTPEAPPASDDVRLAGARTLGAAIEALSRDARVEFDQPLPEDTPVTPYDAPLPFWHALDHVLDQADLDIDYYGGDANTLRLRPRRENRPSRVDSAAYAGIYRLEPTIVTSQRVLRQSELSGLSVEVELAWKPGVTPIGVSLPMDQLTAAFDDGQSVRAQGEFGSLEVATGREIPSAELRLPMQLPAGQPSKITSLSGRIHSMLPGPMHRFEFPLRTISVSEATGSVTVRLEDVRKNGELHEVRLGVEFASPGTAMDSHRGFLLDNEAFVLRGDGTRIEHLGYQLYRQTNSGIGIGYLFDLGPAIADETFVYETPTAVVKNEIDFIIDDIALP